MWSGRRQEVLKKQGKIYKTVVSSALCTSQLYRLATLGCQLKDFHKQVYVYWFPSKKYFSYPTALF